MQARPARAGRGFRALGLSLTVTLSLATVPAVAANDAAALARDARAAISPDTAVAEPARVRLRDAGPTGLEALQEAHRALIDQHAPVPPDDVRLARPVFRGATAQRTSQDVADASEWQRVREAIGAVAAQQDAHLSGLYWYTDWDRAAAAARAQDKPIVSLRLLGRLDEGYSCANSRFFRTALYPDANVQRALADGFVLHWQSVRPVPRITIDMGDGRRIERTVTGNSIHYILDADGRVLDAVPGMYAPGTFADILDAAATLHRQRLDDAALAQHHGATAARLVTQWQAALVTHGLADAAAALPGELETMIDDAMWVRLGRDYVDAARIGPAGRALMREHRGEAPPAARANMVALTKRVVEDPFIRVVREFQHSIARDTALNEYTNRRQILHWLGAARQPVDLAAFNERVYARLFHAPLDDPWMGLVPEHAYGALEGEGLVWESQAVR